MIRHLGTSEPTGVLERLVSNDMFPAVLVLCLGLSTGYLGCCAMVYGPQSSGLLGSEREMAGMVMTMFLIIGLCLGSWTGLAVLKLGW